MRKIENKISVQFATEMLIKQASHPPNSFLTIGEQAEAVYFCPLAFSGIETNGPPLAFPRGYENKKDKHTHPVPKIEPGDHIFLTNRSVRNLKILGFKNRGSPLAKGTKNKQINPILLIMNQKTNKDTGISLQVKKVKGGTTIMQIDCNWYK